MSMLGRLGPKAAGGWIIYRRGAAQVWVEATWGRTEFQVETNGDVRIQHSDRDAIVAWDLLIIDGIRAIPQRGDQFTVVLEDHGDNEVFEVLAPGGSEPWAKCDPEGRMIRIHGKKLQ
jgi:hypothetical protein